MKKDNLRRTGFTLIELLVTIAILSILSGGILVGAQSIRESQYANKVRVDLLAIENALEQYSKDNNRKYPIPQTGTNINVLCFDSDLNYEHDCGSALLVQGVVDNALLTRRYLQEVPVNPFSGARYSYGVSGDGRSFMVAGVTVDRKGNRVAGTRSSIRYGFAVPSLIRAYDGPRFVIDGEPYLPASPYPDELTATLFDITGTVEVTDESDKSVSDLKEALEPGFTVTVVAGGSALLYFSDGSVTRVGSGSGATKLTILPDSAVEQNDKNGIITKIRLKLFSGKIWNKVVRLSKESEFTVETTSAIAGVRGTEFGIDADTKQLIVYSGSVWVKENIPGKLVSVAPGGTPKQADITPSGPQNTKTIADDILLEEIEELHVSSLLSPSVFPFVVSFAADTSGPYVVYVSFNGSETEDVFGFDGFEIFGDSQTEGFRKMKDGALGSPLADITDFSYDNSAKAYRFELDYDQNPDNLLWKNEWQEGAPTRQENILLRAYRLNNNGQRIYSAMSWPPIGFFREHPKVFKVVDLRDGELYPEFAFWDAELPKQQQALMITQIPDSLDLGANASLKSNKPCNWKLTSGGGLIPGANQNQTTVSYNSIANQNQIQIMNEVANRFTGKSEEQIGVKCDDGNEVDEKFFSLAYAPLKISAEPPNGSGYAYSYNAGTDTWNNADVTCGQLTEGGLSWGLPDIGGQSGGIDIADGNINNKTSISEIDLLCENDGQVCINLSDANEAWLMDVGGNGHKTVVIFNSAFSSDFDNQNKAFRCVEI